MLKINDDNYDYYKGIFSVIWKHTAKNLDPEIVELNSPIDVLSEWELKSKSLAKKGLKEGLRDILSGMSDLSDESLQELDKLLKAENYPGLMTMVAQIKETPKKVIDRGKINSRDEYYIIKEVLDDMESGLSNADRIVLNGIFGEYEESLT